MAYFRYQVTGSNGQVLEGTIQAKDAQQAQYSLMSRGIHGAQILNDADRLDFKAVRTKHGTDKQRHFLFAQVAQQLKAGINPAQVFENILRVMHYPHFRGSFDELKTAATNGRPLSEALARYPDLYPDHVVGTIHAGEQGGFLAEAFFLASEQAGDAHKFRRYHWFVYPIIIAVIISLPVVFAAKQALVLAAQRLNGDPMDFPKLFVQFMKWPYGPMTLAILVGMFALRALLSTYEARRFRHRVALNVPIYGARSRNECIATFTWALARLAKAGIPPHASWQMATEVVPNVEIAARLRDMGKRLTDGSKLSDAIFGAKLFPPEYAPMVSTGEVTGDMEGALTQLEQVSRNEFDVKSQIARNVGWRVFSALFFLLGGVLLLVIAMAWYYDVIKAVVEQFEMEGVLGGF